MIALIEFLGSLSSQSCPQAFLLGSTFVGWVVQVTSFALHILFKLWFTAPATKQQPGCTRWSADTHDCSLWLALYRETPEVVIAVWHTHTKQV